MLQSKKLEKIASLVIEDIKKELSLQGHEDTGALAASMRPWSAGVNNEMVVQAYALGYINELEYGVKPQNIRLTKAEFNDLREWVGRKIATFGESDKTSIAAAIVRKWQKEGKPLNTSKEFSKTGEILNAISTAYEKNETKYNNALDESIINDLDEDFLKIKSSTI